MSLDWPLTLTTQPSTSKLSDNPSLIQTAHYYRQFALFPEKESPYISSEFNLLNIDTLLTVAFSMASVSVLIGFDRTVSSL